MREDGSSAHFEKAGFGDGLLRDPLRDVDGLESFSGALEGGGVSGQCVYEEPVFVERDGQFVFRNDVQGAEFLCKRNLLQVESTEAGRLGLGVKDSLSGAHVDVVDL